MEKICKVKFCGLKVNKKGYCCKHYHQIRRHDKILSRTRYDSNEIVTEGELCRMKIYKDNGDVNGIVLLDKENVEKIRDFKWYLSKFGYVVGTNRKKWKDKIFWLHRLILGLGKHKQDIDHKNGDKLDNRKINLRLATRSQNLQNMKMRKNISGYKGVDWHPQTQKWRSSLKLNGKRISLGCYYSKEDAALAYNRGAEKHFGEFARKNEVILSL